MDLQPRSFASHGVRCDAWLATPPGPPAPVIVMGHGLGAVKEMGLVAYVERFVDAGFACLAFDYRGFGASDGEPRQVMDIRAQLEDWAAAIAYARSLDDVDPSRVVLWGTSFGGGHVIATAARDQQVAAAIAQCPFTDGWSSTLAVDLKTSLGLTLRGLKDLAASLRGRPRVLVPTAGKPGEVALMTAPDVWDGYLGLTADAPTFRNEVTARFALDIVRHRPGRRTATISCPILFCVCDDDSVAPPKATRRHARRAPRGEVIDYPCGHFDIYTGESFEATIVDQIDFLRRHLGPLPHGSPDGSA